MDPILTGQLSFDAARQQIVWEGVWYTELQQQQHQLQTFRYTSPSASPPRAGLSLSLTGHFYVLDSSKTATTSAKRRVQVGERQVRVEVLADCTVRGSGSNRFGRFELVGVLDAGSLRVTRKYLPAAAAPVAPVAPAVDALSLVQQIVRELHKKDKHGWFAQPVNTALPGLERYSAVVLRPMDLGTVQARLDQRDEHYQAEAAAALQDVRLVFANARLFNSKGTLVHRIAGELAAYLESRVRLLLPALAVAKPSSSSTPAKPAAAAAPVAAATVPAKRVRVAKKFFQHVNELDNAELYRSATCPVVVPAPAPTISRSSSLRCKKKPALIIKQHQEEEEECTAAGFDSFDELDELSDFEVEPAAATSLSSSSSCTPPKQVEQLLELDEDDDFLTDYATPASSSGDLSPFPCPSPAPTHFE